MKLRHKVVPNTEQGFQEMLNWLSQHGVTAVHACLEATSHFSMPVAEFLVQKGYRVSMVNPAAISGFARCELARAKSDRADAARIARYCHLHRPRLWSPPSQASQTLSALVHRIDSLEQMRRMELNRADGASALVQESLTTILAALEKELTRLRYELRTFIEKTPCLCRKRDLLLSIPGIGEITALVLLAELERAEGLESARQAAAFAGLVPRIHESGSSVRGRSPLSKQGNQRLRKALYFPAVTAMRHNPLLRAFAERLQQAGKAKMVVLGAVMRKLLQLAFGILKSGKPFDPLFSPG